MRRELLENTRVQPFVSGGVIERAGFLSGVIGALIGTAGTLTVTVEHSSDGTGFEPVTDSRLFIEKSTDGGSITTESLEKDAVVNFDLDLAGLKDYLKVTVSGDAAAGTALAIALGDHCEQPV